MMKYLNRFGAMFYLTLSLLALIGCNTELPGKVILSHQDQKIPLINENRELVYLDSGPNVAEIGMKTITIQIAGKSQVIRFPFWIYPKDDFYYSASQLNQKVDIQGSTEKKYGQEFSRIEDRRCNQQPNCLYCNDYYQVEVTYREVFKNSRFDFYATPHADLLGYFQEDGLRRYEEAIRERQLTYCRF